MPDDVQDIARASVNAMMLRAVALLPREKKLIENALERGALDFDS